MDIGTISLLLLLRAFLSVGDWHATGPCLCDPCSICPSNEI